jgi:hypothetical protein
MPTDRTPSLSAAQGRWHTLLGVLQHSGLTPAAAEASRLVGIALRERTSRTKLEYAVLIDAQTGQPVADPAEGDEDAVDLQEQFSRCAPGRAYLGLHTHPRSLPFSLQDVALLLRRHPTLCAIAAVARSGGTWYAMGVAPGRAAPTVEAMRAAMQQTIQEISDGYGVPPYPDPAAARRALLHDAWTRAAPGLGLL